MTVSELIRLLQQMPPDFKVYARDRSPYEAYNHLYPVASLTRLDGDRAIEIVANNDGLELYPQYT